MFDTVSAKVELIERNNIFRKVVADVIICTKLTDDRFFRSQHVSDLNLQHFTSLAAYEINFFIACFANRHYVAATQQFKRIYVL